MTTGTAADDDADEEDDDDDDDDDNDDDDEDDTINVARRKISALQVFYVVLFPSVLVYWKLC